MDREPIRHFIIQEPEGYLSAIKSFLYHSITYPLGLAMITPPISIGFHQMAMKISVKLSNPWLLNFIPIHSSTHDFEQDDYKLCPLVIAAEENNEKMFNAFLKKGAQLNTLNHAGYTLLDIAAKHNFKTAIYFLIQKTQINVNQRNRQENTALHTAVTFGSLSAIEALIDLGAEVNVQGFMERTPLHMIASFSSEAIDPYRLEEKQVAIYHLLCKNQNLNKNLTDEYGNTALHLSMRQARLWPLLAILIQDNEVNLNQANNRGETALNYIFDISNQEKFSDIIPILHQQGHYRNSENNRLLHELTERMGTLRIYNHEVETNRALSTNHNTPEKNILDFNYSILPISDALKNYLDTQKKKTKPSNQELFKKYNIKNEEYNCSISLDVPNIPVTIYEKVYEFTELLKLKINQKGKRMEPQTKFWFNLKEIQPAFTIQSKIDALIKEATLTHSSSTAHLKL